MLGKRFALLCVGICVSFWLAGCGGSAPSISVAVTVAASTVDGNDTTTLTATVTNDVASAGVSWTTSGGTLSNTSTTGATITLPAPGATAQTVTVTATSVHDTTEKGTVTITIPAETSTAGITNAGLVGSEGVIYSINLNSLITGGIAPYTWSATGLPACLTLSPSGTLSTTSGLAPNAACAGTYNDISITATDSGKPTPETSTVSGLSLTITAAQPLAIAGTVTPATATAGVAYAGSVAAGTPGGVAPLIYTVTGGALPAWATLNAATGAITGMPTTQLGTSNFTIQVADSFGDTPASQAYTLTVNPGAATHFAVAATSSTTVTAGGTVGYKVTALDVDGNTATGYAGMVKFTSSDSQATVPANSTLTNGVGNFTATLKTAGTQSITATDTVTATITGTLSGITVSAAAVAKLQVTATSPQTAGTAFNATVTAQDQYGNTATSDTELVQITSSDSAAVLPANAALVAGVQTVSVTLKTAGSQTVSAKGLTSLVTGTSNAITVNAAAAASFTVTSPGTAAAGQQITVVVTAKDTYGNTATSYAGTVAITSSDSAAVLPANSTLTSGVGSFLVTLKTAGSQTVTAKDTANASITGSTSVTVGTSGLAKIVVTGQPASIGAGTAFNVTVTAEDFYGNVITTNTDTIAITSSDGSAVLPANAALVAGTKTFPVTLKTAGSQTVTATDQTTVLSPAPVTITVNPAAATTLAVTAPGSATAGTAINVSVTAKDQYGNTATGYTGTVQFSSSDSAAALPANSTLSGGVGTFPVTLKTVGSQTVTATDTVTGSITGTTGTIAVSAGVVSKLVVTAPGTATAGTAITATVTAEDAYNNVVTSDTDTIQITSTDSAASLPPNAALSSGTQSFLLTLKTAGNQTITAKDITTSLSGTSSAITVSAAPASKLLVTAPANATNAVPFNFNVTAEDQYNNTVTSFPDTVTFSSTDGSAVLPGNSGLTNGTKQFSATLKTNGTQTITATDLSNGSVTGTSGSINVSTALIVTTSSLNPLDVGQTPTQMMTASGGSGIPADYSWTWTAQSGSTLPPGLSMSANGAITGSPTTGGVYNVTVKVADSGTSTNATANLSFTIYNALSLPAANSLPTGYVGESYTGAVAGSGGSGSGNLSIAVTTALSPTNGTLATSVSGTTVNITGTPATAEGESLGVTLTDNATSNSINANYSFTISTPTYALPTSNPPAATVNQAYSATITANVTGGSGNYTWLINGNAIASTGSTSPLGASGLAAEFYASDTGGTTLSLTTALGTPPSTSGSFQFTAQIKDNVTNLTSSAQQYTIQVNSAGSTVSGTISLNNNCGSSGSLPVFTVGIYDGSTLVASTTSDPSTGNYSFTGIANGTYTITPSLTGTGVSSLFYPTSETGVVVDNSNVTGENFNAAVGYTVSGTATYSGTTTAGQLYIDLINSSCGNSGGNGTSILYPFASGGNFTIRGVPPGSYTLQATMDPTAPLDLGEGAPNEADPTGSVSGVTVTTESLTGQSVTLHDPTLSLPTTTPNVKAVSPIDQGVVISFGSVTDNNGFEIYTSYTIQWATTTSGFSSSNQATFKAVGNSSNVWFLHNGNANMTGSLVNGTAYYFRLWGSNPIGAGPSVTSPSTYTIGQPTTGNKVTGTITIPSSVTIKPGAVLYAGVYNQDTEMAYGQAFTSPSNSTGNSFTAYVPTGSNYQVYGILDENNDGLIDAGDVDNVRNSNGSNSIIVSISGTTSVPGVTLPASNATAVAQTQYSQSTGSGGTGSGYNLTLNVSEGNELPVAITLTSGPNVLSPVDFSNYCQGCGSNQFQYNVNLNGATPAVGDTYTFSVTYSGSSTPETVTAAVTAFGSTGAIVGAGDLATSLSPAVSGTSTPTFTWTDPSSASNYTYQFQLGYGNGGTIWQIPGQNSNSNGFDSSITSITWGTDPTGGGSTPSLSPLTPGTYNWQISVQDSKGNQANKQTYFVVP